MNLSTAENTTVKRRLACLDGVRALAAYFVLMHHVSFAAGTTLNSKWGNFFSRMDVGVSIFFVLSGFLLFKPMVDAMFEGRAFVQTRKFWRRRFMRIFPSYWLALFVMLIIGAVKVGGFGGFIVAVPLIQIYHPDHAIAGLTQAWSLATEVSFYFVLPWLAIALRRFCNDNSTNRFALKLLGALGSIYLFSFVFRFGVRAWHPSFENIIWHWLPSMIDLFALGMMLAVISSWAQRNSDIAKRCKFLSQRATLWVASAAIIFIVTSTQLGLAVGLNKSSFPREILMQTLYGLIGLFLILPFALGPDENTIPHRFFSWRPIAWMGLVSYGVYLWHELTFSGNFADRVMPWTLFDGDFMSRLIVATVVTLIIAGLNHRYIEDPIAKRFS